ncbi:MAG: uracil-DNA glycosylase [Bacteroidetes bacterium]|nr:uracil-DNA glycosylase [Rhodothermia bacterium]MCS7154799.1 uracil-DNA glycosylase [Bacteroidota bacterium]MCX7907044.1 uracil-DNA glycosylase [Bacteroidota bacterium]MDW8137592.1 uracil-DNA glycosylase [Bacteroidota bacterium]MDW8285454.1 uracil-DNA glycosylase [Bacteroidota bacterium]
MACALDALYAELITCRACPRLVAWREAIGRSKRTAYRDWDYWARPVPGFGDPEARLLIFGLAPGAHGANRTGRMFTGDASGDFLYRALFELGWASQPTSRARGDGLLLRGVYVTAAVRCAPPQNRPERREILRCAEWTRQELALLPQLRAYVALGRIAHEALLRHYGLSPHRHPFAHGAVYELPDRRWLVGSYHVSRQNTQTGRLTASMFRAVLEEAGRRAGLR